MLVPRLTDALIWVAKQEPILWRAFLLGTVVKGYHVLFDPNLVSARTSGNAMGSCRFDSASASEKVSCSFLIRDTSVVGVQVKNSNSTGVLETRCRFGQP